MVLDSLGSLVIEGMEIDLLGRNCVALPRRRDYDYV